MDRRDFLKRAAFVGALSMVDFSALGKALSPDALAQAAPKAGASGGADIVAVMNGEPAAMLDKMLAEFGGIGTFVKSGQSVVLKPNIGWDRTPEFGANTNPDLVAAMVKKCLGAGAKEVIVFDHTCDEWRKCYTNSGIEKAVEAAGGKMVPGNDESYYVEVALPTAVKYKKAKIHKAIVDCDVWFNMPVLKHHGGSKMSCAMKNYMGIVWDRSDMHRLDLQQCIADAATYSKRPALNIVDAYRVMKENGPQGRSVNDSVMLKGLFAARDIVAADTASLKFFSQVRPITLNDASHVLRAEELKLGTTKIENLKIQRINMA